MLYHPITVAGYCPSGQEFDGTDCVNCSEWQYKDNDADGLLSMCMNCTGGKVTLIQGATQAADCQYGKIEVDLLVSILSSYM